MTRSAERASHNPAAAVGRPVRILFLDDDPLRAEVFLVENPDAVWVQTVEECKTHLAEGWDEVHLDHDLGGEVFVDFERDDCGMEVVRWICLEPRPHLQATRFYIHSHNPNAANMMALHLEVSGFQVEARPFGTPPPPPRSSGRSSLQGRLGSWLLGLARRLSG